MMMVMVMVVVVEAIFQFQTGNNEISFTLINSRAKKKLNKSVLPYNTCLSNQIAAKKEEIIIPTSPNHDHHNVMMMVVAAFSILDSNNQISFTLINSKAKKRN